MSVKVEKTENKNELKLVFVIPVTNDKSYYEYDFLFSETPDVVWGVDWTDNAPNLCGDISPDPSTYDLIKRIKVELPLKVIQENTYYIEVFQDIKIADEITLIFKIRDQEYKYHLK